MPPGILTIVVAAELAVFIGSLVAWSFALSRKSHGQPLYPYEPRRPVPWGLFDLALLAFAALAATTIAVTIVGSLLDRGAGGSLTELKPHQFALLILTDSAVSLTLITCAIVFLRWRVRAGLQDFGIEPAKVDSDVGLGMIAFVMLAVPVFIIQIWLLSVFPNQDQHPLIEMLKKDSGPQLVLVSIFVAVVAAPVVEEYFFRVLLQGWLENVACRWDDLPGLLFGGFPSAEQPGPVADPNAAGDSSRVAGQDSAAEDAPFGIPVIDDSRENIDTDPVLGPAGNPYASPLVPALVLPETTGNRSGPLRPRHWPVFVSAGLFAAMHLGHGYDPIPLFFLALGLGYLYQQTHRVIPCIVVHLLLNATSIVALWLSICYGVDV